MISTHEAKIKIEKLTPEGLSESVDLLTGLGKVLAKDVFSPIDLPQFDQSAMDGYALKLGEGSEFKVIGEIQAGDDASNIFLKENEAVKIFTGALCPSSADLVCRIEDIQEDNNEKVIAVLVMPKLGANIRRKGEQIRQGEFALAKGHQINPASIGFLANLGLTELTVFRKPKLALLSTGDELMSPGLQLPLGKIYESNAVMLQAALKEVDIQDLNLLKTVDTLDATIFSIEKLLDNADMLIVTGGISVGDYDFVASALKENGVEEVFHKVSQKPGKPFYFGVKGEKLVFALPGNPAAVLTCYYQYVLPAIQKFSGGAFKGLESQYLKSKSSIDKTNPREQFLKAIYVGEEVEVLEGQSSAMLHTFATSNALIYLPSNCALKVGEDVLVYKLR